MRQKREFDEHLPAVKIIEKFGGNANFAKAIKRAPSTTDRYLVNGYFFARDTQSLIADIHAAAKELKIKLTKDDFVDLRLFQQAAAA